MHCVNGIACIKQRVLNLKRKFKLFITFFGSFENGGAFTPDFIERQKKKEKRNVF